ncbi:uncharacterized protein LOC135839450 [Planococcus citri]|uniref:uncharacterized protein LOC135839450 n=1 Tax=Planococcus citri TaxID=170843 RepID=UPI0031FA179F
MARHLWFLLVILISCSITSGLIMGRWANGTLLTFNVKLNCSFVCTDKNEVEWKVDSTDEAKNYVQVVSPNEKILRIENISRYDTGVYKCMSKDDPYRFIKLVVHIFGDKPGTRLLGYQPTSYTGHVSLEHP